MSLLGQYLTSHMILWNHFILIIVTTKDSSVLIALLTKSRRVLTQVFAAFLIKKATESKISHNITIFYQPVFITTLKGLGFGV